MFSHTTTSEKLQLDWEAKVHTPELARIMVESDMKALAAGQQHDVDIPRVDWAVDWSAQH